IKAINYERGPGHDPDKPPRYIGRNQHAAKRSTRDNGGAELEALKSRLPATDDGGGDGGRRGGGGGISVAIGASRIVRPELPGNTDTLFDEPRGGDEF